MEQSVVQAIRHRLPALELREQEPLSAHCSFRIGGPAAVMLLPKSEEELTELYALLAELGQQPLLMGNGTNLLVTDAPLDRIVVKTCDGVGAIRREGECLVAACGVKLSQLAVYAQSQSLAGLEFAHGIPGSLGGAVSMNAGAYGGEMKDVVVSARCLDQAGALRTLAGEEQGFAYRRSAFQDAGLVILSARLRLTPGDGDRIRERMRELMEKRRASQPLEKPSAGSTFKRPQTGYAAALIDQAGLKGCAVGGAQVSEKHAGFVINRGGATYADVRKLMDHIRETVFRKFSVELEPEVRIIEN